MGVKTHACNGGGRRQHFTHAGAPLRPFVTDDQNFPLLNLFAHDGLGGFLLGVEDPGRPFVCEHLFQHRGLFDHASAGGDIAVKDGQTALGTIGVVQAPDHFDIFYGRPV